MLPEVVRIRKIKPHPNADNLELAYTSRGRIVVGKGEFREGGTGLFVPVGSLVPVTEDEFSFLRPTKGKMYHRVKTIRLRGIKSKGLLVPNKYKGYSGLDVGAWLGVIPPPPSATSSVYGVLLTLLLALLILLFIARAALGYEGQQCQTQNDCANGEVCVKHYNVGKCTKVIK